MIVITTMIFISPTGEMRKLRLGERTRLAQGVAGLGSKPRTLSPQQHSLALQTEGLK